MQTFMKKKESIIILITMIVLIIIFISSFLIYTEMKNNPKYYTDAEHLQNVTELMNNRMDMLNISDYEIAPMYNANEELSAFVIDYREGHIYVKVYNPSFVLKLFRVSMYTHAGSNWFRFIDYEKNNSTIKWQKTKNISLLKDFPNRFWEIDEE